MLSTTDLANEMRNAIMRTYSVHAAIRFENNLKHYHGEDFNYGQLSPNLQIRQMNAYWRKQLESIPEPTELKAWLCEGDNLDAYLHAFENHWIYKLNEVGLL